MRAKLKGMHSPDVDFDSYWPDEADNFGFLIQAMIGPEDENTEEAYGVQVCTPKWLTNEYIEQGSVFGRHLLIVFEYDVEHIKNKISRYCERCVADSWSDIALQLEQIGQRDY